MAVCVDGYARGDVESWTSKILPLPRPMRRPRARLDVRARHQGSTRTLTFMGKILPSRVVAPGPTATTSPSFNFLPTSGRKMPDAVCRRRGGGDEACGGDT